MAMGRGANGKRGAASLAVAGVCLLLTGGAQPAVWAAAANGTVAMPTTTALAARSAKNASSVAIVQQPRPFGYVLGDTLTQLILLRTPGQAFRPTALPPLERAGLWFARRSSKIVRADDDRRWLAIEYQLVNAPQTLVTVSLPAVTLKSNAGTELVVPEWPISVAPLTPRAAFAKGGLQDLRVDHPAPLLPTSIRRRQLEIWMSAFALTVVIWIGWWLVRSLRAARNQPFASALRAIRRTGDDSAAAWLALHRAFDRTAGRALQTTTLPALFKKAPHFETQRPAIEQFFAESNLRFFGVVPAGGAVASPLPAGGAAAPSLRASGTASPSLRALAAALRRIEKQHER